MPAGFQVFNEGGVIQVGDDWKNFALIDKVTKASANINFGRGFNGVQYDLENYSDLVFIRSEQAFGVPAIIHEPGSPSRLYVASAGSAGTPLTLYVFRQQPPTPTTFGLQVFNSSGELMFDAVSKFCKIEAVLPNTNMEVVTSFQLLDGKDYAVMVPTYAGKETVTVNNIGGEYMVTKTYNAKRVLIEGSKVSSGHYVTWTAFQQRFSGSVPPPSAIFTFPGGPLVVADVTNY
ncbi:hypothetical protein [Pseudomonas farsensis]|uniref:IgGFc-binding protein N-terminal domain-containing protein n=1 Tax=Pseudomonas farsensis TaxID=2745492 RepID=A0ABU8QN60_9PSED